MKATLPIPHAASTSERNPWLIAEGDYRANLKQSKPPVGGKIRLVFTVFVPGCSSTYLAAKNYRDDLSWGTALRNDLISLLGRDLTPEELQAGSVDTRELVGKPADIRITHLENDRFDHPFVHIQGVYPAGALVNWPGPFHIDGRN
jgi:hypothetical protein